MDITQAVNEAVIATFSDMAFMDAEPIQTCSGCPPFGQIIGVEFLHPLEGHMILHLTTPIKQMVIENIHGVDWNDLARREVDDCLMELVNIMAGNFLLLVESGQHRYALSLPQVWYDESDIMDCGTLDDYYFIVNDEAAKVSLTFSPAGASSKG